MIRSLSILLLVLIASLHAACNPACAATLSGTVMMTYSNKPYVGAVLIRPLSTPLTINGNLVTGGDFKAITDGNGNLSVALQAGNYRVTIGADKGFTIDVPNDNNTYTWIERIITSLTWNSSIIPSTNTSTASLISYTNVAEMIAATPPTSVGNRVAVLGRTTPYDGGGGDFWFDSTSSASTNLGTIFAPSSGSGRWKRLFPGATVHARWFGAKADGVTDDTVALQNFLDWRDAISGKAGTYVFNAGHYRWNSITTTGGMLIGDGHVHRGNNVVAETTVVCEQILGATGDMLVIGGSSTANKSVTVDGLLMLGHPEYNLRNAMTITAVYAGDRLHFDVASAPVIEGGKNGPPYLGFGALFDDSNHYLGSFCLQSFITNGVTSATNTVNIMSGTDAYATVSGENVLRVGFKVCFPSSTEWFVGSTSFGQRAFSSRAGYSAIRVWNSDQSNLENLKLVNWHTGIVIASSGYTCRNIETYNCHLSGMIAEPMGFLADNTSYGFLLFNGKYQADDALAASPYTLKNTLYRSSAIGFAAIGAQAKHGQIVAGPSAIYGTLIYGGVNSHIDNLLIESPALYPVYLPVGNSGTPQTTTTINRLRILGGYSTDTTPDNRPSTIPIIDIGSSGAGLSVAQLTVGRFTESGNGTNWSWGYLYRWPSYATNTGLCAIGNLVDPNRMVAAHNPGGTYYQQGWNLLSGTTVTGGSATQPIMTWQRDVAEPNGNKLGITYSGGARLLFAHDGDGVVNDVGYTLESTASATQLTMGLNSGAASPRSAILQGEPAIGTDVGGGSVFLGPGVGTGAATTGGTIYFQTPAVGSSGTSAQTKTTRLSIGPGGHLMFTGMAADPSVGTMTGGLYYNSSSNSFRWHNGTSWQNLGSGGGGGGGSGDVVGPASATDGAPVLFDGTTGKLVKNSTPTGTGNPVLQTSPTLTTPTLGVATATSVNKVAFTAPATGSTLTIADGKTLTANNSLTLAGTDSTVMTFPSTSASVARTDAAQTFSGVQTFGGGALYIGSAGGTAPYLFSFSGNSDTTPSAGGLGLTVYNYATGNTEYGVSFRGASITATSGDSRAIHVARAFAPTSGTATWSQMSIQPTINQTGGANGVTRGLYINPTVTAAADFRALEVASGKSLFSGDVQLGSSSTLNWNADTYLVRVGANNVGLRNGGNGQSLDIYNTYTDATTWESLRAYWTANVAVVGTDKGSVSGTARALSLMTGGTSRWQLETGGHLVSLSDNSYDLGKSTQRVRTGYFGTAIGLGTGGNAVVFSAESTGVLQLGTDAGTPATQTLKAFDGSGSNIGGAPLVLAGGKSTGNGRGGDVWIQTSLDSAGTSSPNNQSTRSGYSAKPVALTESTASQIATISVGTGKYVGGTITCTVNAGDGTDFQALTSTLNIAAVNKAGTITYQITQVDGTAAVSAGTLTATYTLADNGSGVLGVKCNATSSLSQTVLNAKWVITALNSDDVATVTPN